MNTCLMCGALVSEEGQDLHDAWHVAYHEHDRNLISVVEQASGAVDALGDVVDLHGEIIREWY